MTSDNITDMLAERYIVIQPRDIEIPDTVASKAEFRALRKRLKDKRAYLTKALAILQEESRVLDHQLQRARAAFCVAPTDPVKQSVVSALTGERRCHHCQRKLKINAYTLVHVETRDTICSQCFWALLGTEKIQKEEYDWISRARPH